MKINADDAFYDEALDLVEGDSFDYEEHLEQLTTAYREERQEAAVRSAEGIEVALPSDVAARLGGMSDADRSQIAREALEQWAAGPEADSPET